MTEQTLSSLLEKVNHSLAVSGDTVTVKDEVKLRESVGALVRVSALGSGKEQALARWLVRAAAQALGIHSASIHELYIARGAGKVPTTFTVPAMNLRVLSYDAARAVFRAAQKINAGAFIFEIARSEISYTNQRPAEYTTNMLGAAIAEGYRGPVFIQGDHFQISGARYTENADKEVQAVKDLIEEAIAAGFYNIDVDTSTLVKLDTDDVVESQDLNITLSAEFTAYIRTQEPEGVTVSVGGEIGEVGGHNSTEEELRVYTDGFNKKLKALAPDVEGLSKISIQTGTSHGGVVLPDGSIAEVAVDFDTMLHLSKISREEFGMAGAVQHGASTLPQDAFSKFVDAQACEVHLATGFQNIFYEHAPESLVMEIYAYLDENNGDERKEGMTDDQFYYKTRKRAIGAFKAQAWALDAATKAKFVDVWEAQFDHLFNALSIADTKRYVDEFVSLPAGMPSVDDYLVSARVVVEEEDTSDLAD